MTDADQGSTAAVQAALDEWQAAHVKRRYPTLVVTEVLDRVGSDHSYLSVTFARRSEDEQVPYVAKLFLGWLAKEHPELGGPHLAFFARLAQLDTQDTDWERERLERCADGRERYGHARAFALAWLERLPATTNLGVAIEMESEFFFVDPVLSVLVAEVDDPDAELTLRPEDAARVLARLYDDAHPDRAWRVEFLERGEWHDVAEVERARPPAPVPPTPLRGETPRERYRHASEFARAWLGRIDAAHDIYVGQPFGEELREPVTVRVYRDDCTAELGLREDEVAAAIAKAYGRAHRESAADASFVGEYCK